MLPGRREKTFWTAETKAGGNTRTGGRLDRRGGRQEMFGNSDPWSGSGEIESGEVEDSTLGTTERKGVVFLAYWCILCTGVVRLDEGDET